MTQWPAVPASTHLLGLALAVGSATVKLFPLLHCQAAPAFAPALGQYLAWEAIATVVFCVIIGT